MLKAFKNARGVCTISDRQYFMLIILSMLSGMVSIGT